MLSSAGVCVNVFDDVEANGHGRHGYRPSCPQRLGLQFRECLVVQHWQPLAVQLHVSERRRRHKLWLGVDSKSQSSKKTKQKKTIHDVWIIIIIPIVHMGVLLPLQWNPLLRTKWRQVFIRTKKLFILVLVFLYLYAIWFFSIILYI